MRSPRDSDANARIWVKAKTSNAQVEQTARTLQELQRVVARLRRHVGASEAGLKYNGEWPGISTGGPVTLVNNLWVISSGATAGLYIALQDTPTLEPYAGDAQWDKLSVLDTAALGAWS